MRRALLVLPLLTACYSGGDSLDGLMATPPGNGPLVVWDPFAQPLPELPFPNDAATRPDLTSPTGRRVNVPLGATTAFERRLRGLADQLDGFSTLAPLTVRFASPDPDQPQLARLDLTRIAEAQTGDASFNDDPVLLINVTPTSSHYGQAVVLDFYNGNYPLGLEEPDQFFDADPRSLASNLMLDTYDEDVDGDGRLDEWEDTNQNGQLDAGEDRDGDGRLDIQEDSDGDGVFDHGNLWGTVLGDASRRDRYRDLVGFYEMQTDTLTFRPVVPLDEQTTYAVVLTRDLLGENGEAVRSPFDSVHHLQQTEALRPLFADGILGRFGRSADDVAFAWSFTTQSLYTDMVALREGLYGIGPLAELNRAYPAEVSAVVPVSNTVPQQLLPPEQLVKALQLVFDQLPVGNYDTSRVQPLIDTYGAVDYVVAGDYTSPNLIDAGGGTFDVDVGRRHVTHRPDSLRFFLVVPKREYGTPPFPVAFYAHGYGSMKLEALAFAGGMAKFGIATFVVDAYAHGLPFGDDYLGLVEGLLEQNGADEIIPFVRAIWKSRARDLNGDSFPDNGGDFFTSDLFHSRDAIRQTLVDYVQAIRVFRNFDGVHTWPFDFNGDGAPDLAGDFNGDGQVDVGGPNVPLYTTGMSMGGIHSSLLGALDPAIRAAAPVSPGGVLLEVGTRTDLGGVVKAALLPIMSPFVITMPSTADVHAAQLAWMVGDVQDKSIKPFADTGRNGPADELLPGDRLEVRNLLNGAVTTVVVPADKQVRAGIAADVGDPIQVVLSRANGAVYKEVNSLELGFDFQGRTYGPGEQLTSIATGLGTQRNTPDFRRLISTSQMALDRADPANYAPRYADPLNVRPEGLAPHSTLITLTMGDSSVPISSGLAMARAAGIIDYTHVDPAYGVSQNQLLINNHVMEAIEALDYFANDPCHAETRRVQFDIDDLSDGRHPDDLPRLRKIARPAVCNDPNPPALCNATCVAQPPLRATRQDGDSLRALRIAALDADGRHVIDLPNPNLDFDPSMFVINQIGMFLRSSGRALADHGCLAHNDCSVCAGELGCPDLPPPPSLVVP